MADNEMKGGVEPYTPLTPGAVLGGRRRKSLKLVTKKKARKVLKKLGMKLRGGNNEPEETTPSVPVPKVDINAADNTSSSGSTSSTESTEGGRRRRKGTKKTHRGGRKGKGKRRSLFGMRY